MSTVQQDLTSDGSGSKCVEPQPKKTDTRTQFVFLGRSAVGGGAVTSVETLPSGQLLDAAVTHSHTVLRRHLCSVAS